MAAASATSRTSSGHGVSTFAASCASWATRSAWTWMGRSRRCSPVRASWVSVRSMAIGRRTHSCARAPAASAGIGARSCRRAASVRAGSTRGARHASIRSVRSLRSAPPSAPRSRSWWTLSSPVMDACPMASNSSSNSRSTMVAWCRSAFACDLRRHRSPSTSTARRSGGRAAWALSDCINSRCACAMA